jgi:hypothetical protein
VMSKLLRTQARVQKVRIIGKNRVDTNSVQFLGKL